MNAGANGGRYCYSKTKASNQGDVRVGAREVIGTWVATRTGIDGLRYAGHTKHLKASDHVMVIRPDGTCSFRSFVSPYAVNGADKGFISMEGEWTLDQKEEQSLTIRLRDQEPSAIGPYFYFAEVKGDLILWQYADDPDAWKYFEFAKQTNHAR